MANQPENPSYDAGVYQLETVDPVDGGVGAVSNRPLLNLANRTAYLKQHVDNLENGTTIPPTVAPLNSPAFTGTPTVPTAPVGDNSTKIANTAFVNTLLSGVISVNVAGGSNVSLNQSQYGNGIIILTGTLTANISVFFPTTGQWLVVNNTSGAYTITCKPSTGTGVVVTQGKSSLIYGNGTNIATQQTDFISPALTGNPTAPTAASGDNSTSIANTAFVFNSRGGVTTVNVAGNSNVTLTAAQYGAGIVTLTGALTGNINVIVPNNGQWIFENNTTGAYSITVKTAAGTGQLIPQGQSELLYADGTNVQIAGAASTVSFVPSRFTATAGQTSFPVSYTPGNIIVSRNGAVLTPDVDFTATDGANVVLTTGANAGDIVEVYAFSSFIVANALDKTKNLSDVANPATALSNIGGFPSTGGTITGNVTANGTLTIASGTANGVAYLNASKALTTSSALTFNGSTLALNGDLSTTGNVTLGDASTDTVQVNGTVGIGGLPASGVALAISSSNLTATSQYGFRSYLAPNSSATGSAASFFSTPAAGASVTLTNFMHFWAGDFGLGAGSSVLNQHGVFIADQTKGTNNYGVSSGVSAGANKWNIYASGSAANYFAGSTGIGITNPSGPSKLFVDGGSANYALSLTNNAESYTLGSSAYNIYTPAGTIANISTKAASIDTAALIYFGAFNASNGASGAYVGAIAGVSNGAANLVFGRRTGATSWAESFRIDTAGNAGLGVAPNSTWTDVALQIGYSGSIHANKTQNYNGIGVNTVQVNSTTNYLQNGYALDYTLNGVNGSFTWKNAPSGTAGGAITYTTAMTLFNSGGLSLGNTTDPGAANLSVTGSVTAASFSGAGTGLTGTANSLNAGIGVNQTWQDVTASRVSGTTYTNSTGKTIVIYVQALESSNGSVNLSVLINGSVTLNSPTTVSTGGATYSAIRAEIPNGQTYKVTASPSINKWFELR